MSFLIPSSVQTMSSLEIAELTGKRHDNVKADVQKLLEELNLQPPEFSGSLKNNQNQTVEVFNLPKRECLILVSGYSIKMRAAIIDRWTELETANSVPASNDLQFDRASKLAKLCMDTLNLPQSGQLKLMADLGKQFGVPTQFLPSYGIDAPPQAIITTGSSAPTFSLTTGLKDYDMSAKTANQILIGLGILEVRSRPSTKAGAKTFKAFTEAGLKYGKNITSPSNPREVQPHFYVDTFPVILALLGL